MLENALKDRLGKTFIVSHFALIISIIACRLAGKFDDRTTKTALAILVPLLLTYSAAIILDVINRRHKTGRGKTVIPGFAFLVFFVPLMFIVFIAGIIVKQAMIPDSVENFTVFLSLGESFFGIYMGVIFRVLFTPHASAPSEMGASGAC
jgi:hypothetical protein